MSTFRVLDAAGKCQLVCDFSMVIWLFTPALTCSLLIARGTQSCDAFLADWVPFEYEEHYSGENVIQYCCVWRRRRRTYTKNVTIYLRMIFLVVFWDFWGNGKSYKFDSYISYSCLKYLSFDVKIIVLSFLV